MHTASIFLIFIALITFTPEIRATNVNTCDTDTTFDDAAVEISNCTSPPCRLKKGTKIGVEIQLKPERTINKLQNSVFALIVGVPFPFVGVDGTDACSNVFHEDGSEAGCPLEAGKKYVYKNAFDILPIYPRIKVNVQWALEEPYTGKNAHCFRVQSKIVA